MVGFSAPCQASGDIAVIFPKQQSEVSTVFTEIYNGINEGLEETTRPFYLGKYQSKEELQDWLAQHDFKSIIAMGQYSYEFTTNMDLGIPVIYGAVKLSGKNNKYNAISSTYDPATIFKHLKRLAPKVTHIHIVYSDKYTDWMIELAERAAATNGLKLLAYKKDSVKAITKQYLSIIKKTDPEHHAIWLPIDSNTNYKAVLPMLIRHAWEKSRIIFSNSPSHAKSGVLFSVYPDMHDLGIDLAKLVNVNDKSPGTRAIKSLDFAINTRVANHMDIKYNISDYKLVFPSGK